jgi:hypothetical protein
MTFIEEANKPCVQGSQHLLVGHHISSCMPQWCKADRGLRNVLRLLRGMQSVVLLRAALSGTC